MTKMKIFDANEIDSKTNNNIRIFFNEIGSMASIVTKMYASENPDEWVDGWVEVVIQYNYKIGSKEGTGYLYDHSASDEPIKIKLNGRVMWNLKDD